MNRKQWARYNWLLPEGKPRKVRCYDNGGKTADRYTVVFTGNYTSRTARQHWVLGMSGRPSHPQGICFFNEYPTQIDHPTYGHLGRKIKYEDLPEDCQRVVREYYLNLWELPDMAQQPELPGLGS